MIRRRFTHALALLAASAFLALAAAGCGGDEGDDAAVQTDDPIALLETAAAKPLKSAEVRMKGAANIPGFPILGDNLSVTASGPIEWSGSGLPEADLKVTLRAGGQTFPARLTAIDGHVYVDFQGLSYEADPELIEALPLDRAGEGATSLRKLGIDPTDWLKDAKVEDGEDIGGDSTRLVTGTVDKRAVLADLTKALDSPEVRDKIEQTPGAKGLPKLDAETLDKVAEQIGDVHVEVNVDDEGYARRVLGELDFRVPKTVKDAAFDHGTIGLELVIEKVGAKVSAQPPANPRPLSDLLNFAGLIFGVEKPSDIWTTPR
jgi:hypothetical protein